MNEDIAKLTAEIAHAHERELCACDELRDYAYTITEPWEGRPFSPKEHREDGLVVTLFARSLNTFSASVHLARSGFAEQALMLNRSLFEDMVDIHWVVAEPELAVTRYGEHHQHGKMLLADAVAKYPEHYDDIDIPEFDPQERARLDGLFGPFGAKSWTTENLHDRVRAIENQWPDEGSRRHLHFIRDIAHRENNQTLHVSAQALNAMVLERDEDGVSLRVGPSNVMLKRALYGAWWTFVQTATLLIDHFEISMSSEERRARFDPSPFGKQDGAQEPAT